MILIIDNETTGATNGTNGDPFSDCNRLVLAGTRPLGSSSGYCLFDGDHARISESGFSNYAHYSCLVGFNLKFDLHWSTRNKLYKPGPKLWDCQYAQYIIERQKRPYLSLDQTLEYWGLPLKLDIVKTEYWEKGIDTDQVPFDILWEYLDGDLKLTELVYLHQKDYLEARPHLMRLFQMGMMDMQVTYEMEQNGVPYNLKKSLEMDYDVQRRIEGIDSELTSLFGCDSINFNSGDCLSVLLFGGHLKEQYRESYVRVLKSGEEKHKERWAVRLKEYPQLIKPLKGTELKKEGFYATNEDTLIKLKAKATKKVARIIDLLLERAKLDKLSSSYLNGLPQLNREHNWNGNILHGKINHATTRTGRTASASPNQQNFPDQARLCIESRFS